MIRILIIIAIVITIAIINRKHNINERKKDKK